MLVRVRSNIGVWRVDGLDERTATVESILESIRSTRPHVVYETSLSSDPACQRALLPAPALLSSQGISHGAMVYCRVDPATCADNTSNSNVAAAAIDTESVVVEQKEGGGNMRRVIGKDGSIQLVPSSEVRAPEQDRGFRKGMLPLRDMKMQWTCTCVLVCL
jgi:nuclear protein localization protein 4 homolog